MQALAEEPDFEETTLQTAVDLLNASHAYAAADSLAAVLQSISKTPGRLKKKARKGDAAAAAGVADMEGMEGAAAAGKDPEIGALVAQWTAGERILIHLLASFCVASIARLNNWPVNLHACRVVA